jgi:hypothetical protein
VSDLPRIDSLMLHIKALDLDASLAYSEYTHKWFVSAKIEEGGDGCLTRIVEHEETPEGAVEAFFDQLTKVPIDRCLVTNPDNEKRRRHWKWNGAAFREVPH